jgi:hypothetical protein
MRRVSKPLLILMMGVALGCGDDGGSGGDGDGGAVTDGGGTADSRVPGECDDGVDNDGDGYVDWQHDLGCYGPADATEAAGPREDEDGFTTFEIGADSVVVYVSAEGDDGADGATPETAVASLARAAELVRDGEHDFILLRRGDTWRGQTLGRFKSGRDAAGPLVVAAYGDSTALPRLEIDDHFIDHDGQSRSLVALVGLHLLAYRLDPDDPEFDGVTGGGLRYVGNGEHLLSSCARMSPATWTGWWSTTTTSSRARSGSPWAATATSRSGSRPPPSGATC